VNPRLYYRDFAWRLRSARELKGLAAAELAAVVGLSPPAYGELERGRVAVTVGVFKRLAAALGVPWSALLPPPDIAAAALGRAPAPMP
jgi:transcriptional regulator with XRE-family HTH domain